MEVACSITCNADIEPLRVRVQPLVGKICWRARLAYADELKLDFGQRLAYEHPRLKGSTYGSWVLGSRGTKWRLMVAGQLISSRSKRSRIEQALLALGGGTVDAVTVGYRQLGLCIQFDAARTLTIQHESGRPTFELPYWEMFAPGGTCIQAGPGRRWAIRTRGKRKPGSVTI